MSRILKLLITIICINLLFNLNIKSVRAECLSYQEVLKKSIANSFDLKLTGKDIDISKSALKEAKSEYFPTLKTGFNTEYVNDLKNGAGTFSSVGGTFIPPNTEFQNLLSVGLNYNLYDFGVRGKKVSIAKKDVSEKKIVYSQTLRDLKLSIIDLYTQALLTYKEIKIKQDNLAVDKELFNMKQRLFEAGTISKVDLATDAIKVAKLFDDIDNLKIKLKTTLEDISMYTGDKYSGESIEVLDFDDEEYIVPVNTITPVNSKGEKIYQLQAETKKVAYVQTQFDPKKSEEYQIYQFEIEKKKAELAILEKQRLPQFGFYTNYILYGSERSNYMDSFGNLAQTNVSFGISSSLPIFDGFKNSAQRQKTEFEIARLEIERDKKVAELVNKFEKIHKTAQFYNIEIQNQEDLLAKVNNKIEMIDKLDQQKLVNKTEVLSSKEELLSQKLELEKTITSKISNFKKLQIMSEGLN